MGVLYTCFILKQKVNPSVTYLTIIVRCVADGLTFCFNTKSALVLIKEETVEVLDNKIVECNDTLKAIRMNAIQNIGKGSKKADDALLELLVKTTQAENIAHIKNI